MSKSILDGLRGGQPAPHQPPNTPASTAHTLTHQKIGEPARRAPGKTDTGDDALQQHPSTLVSTGLDERGRGKK